MRFLKGCLSNKKAVVIIMSLTVKKLPADQHTVHYESDNDGFLSVYPQSTDMYVNVHDNMEIVYVREGELRLFADDISYLLHGGEAIILNSGNIHFGFTSMDVATVYDAILIDWQKLCMMVDDPETNIFRKLIERKLRFATGVLCENNAADLLHEIHRILAADEERGEGWKLTVISAYYAIASICWKNGMLESIPLYGDENNELWKKDIELFIAFTKYVDCHYMDALAVSDIAGQLHISESKLYKVCRWIVGCPPVEYIARCRLRMAAQYLKSTELSVTEICYACGFRNLSYFIAQFKAYYQETPHRFRQSNTEK